MESNVWPMRQSGTGLATLDPAVKSTTGTASTARWWGPPAGTITGAFWFMPNPLPPGSQASWRRGVWAKG